MPSAPESRDDVVELPPLDADDEAPIAVEDDFVLDDRPEDDDPLDDKESQDLDVGVRLDELEGDLGDDGDGVDIGPIDEGIDVGDEEGDDSDGLGDDDDDDDDELHGAPDDGGAEGTADAPEDEVNEAALPALDADEEGADDGALAEVLFAEATAGAEGETWELVAGAGAEVACVAVAATGGRVIAGGDALLVGAELGAARASAVASGVSAVALADDMLAFADRRGQVLWSRGLAAQAAPLGGFTPAIRGVALAATPGRLFILGDGVLWSFTATGERLAVIEPSGVIAIAAAGSVLAALVRGSDDGYYVDLRRGDDEGLRGARLHGEALAIAASGDVLLAIAAGGRALAIASGAKVAVSRDGGQSFATTQVSDAAALSFVGADERAELLVALADEDAEGALQLVRVPVSGEAVGVGSVRFGLPDPNDDEDTALTLQLARPPPIALAWDAAADVLWIAAPAGLLAYRRAAKH